MKTKNRIIVEQTMGFGKANLYSLLLIFPITIVLLIPFIQVWGLETLELGKKYLVIYSIPVLLIGIILHELIHGISWAYFIPEGMKSIKFGVVWKFLTPYCHCKVPLKVKHYKIGVAMPLIILGILPLLIAVIFGSVALAYFGTIFTLAAGGDIITLIMLRKYKNECFVSDHPDKMGFYCELITEETTHSD